MVATVLEIARAEPLTLCHIAQRVQEVRGEALPCRIETLGEALKREGTSFKRNRYALKESVTKRHSKQAALDKLQVAARDGQCPLFYLEEAGICAHHRFSAAGRHAACPMPLNPTATAGAPSLARSTSARMR
ncbi:hypothetical protein [Paraburkholderia sp. GAS334]|uniref:hypothetical protein n=1 Tax=Paraburkholderia sp. GAS334 TaxID=3035131 RepID=UPI003D21FF70